MKLIKLLEIESEMLRFQKRLSAAIEVAKNDTSGYYDKDKSQWLEPPTNKPIEYKECLGCKESAALKRSATDLVQVLYSLNKD